MIHTAMYCHIVSLIHPSMFLLSESHLTFDLSIKLSKRK